MKQSTSSSPALCLITQVAKFRPMRLGSVAFALVTLLFLLAKADASANATASTTALGTLPSTRDRRGTLISEPPSVRDEERINGNQAGGWGDKIASFLAKSKLALREKFDFSLLKLKALWWRVKSVSPDVVYVKLKLEESDVDILERPTFHLWAKYVEEYNAKYPENQVSVLHRLREQFGDNRLALMLELAKKETDKATKTLGTTLQMELMAYWEDEMRTSLGVVFKILQVDQDNPTLLTGVAHDVWSLYFNHVYGIHSMTLFEQLYECLDEPSLSMVLVTAKESKKTRTLATDLQRQLRDVWLERSEEPELVFRHLLLDEHPNRLLDRPEMKVWMGYVKKYEAKTKKRVDLKGVLQRYYKRKRIKIIINSATTTYGKHLAKRIETPPATN